MSPRNAKRIDALHAEIAAIVSREKAKLRRANPPLNSLWPQVAEAKLDMLTLSPQHRYAIREAVASLRPLETAK